MADPLSIATGVITLAGFALSASVQLYNIINGLQSQNRKTRALQSELGALKTVLESLFETINSSEPDVDFSALRTPLEQCGEACNSYSQLIAKFTKHTTSTRSSVRDWFKQQYLWGDVTDFKEMITAYKSTITIAIVNVNLRVTTSVRPEALADYKLLMSNTAKDLNEHLNDINDKIEDLSLREPQDADPNVDAWRTLLAERQCAQQGLEFCAQLSSEIERLEPQLSDVSLAAAAPTIAQRYVDSGVSTTKGSIQAMRSQLQSHTNEIEQQILSMSARDARSTQETVELADLQRAKNSIETCIQLISQAEEQAAAVERRNLFEDITVSESSFNFTGSTVGDLVTARKVNISGGSVNVSGQLGSAELGMAFENLGRVVRVAPSPAHAAWREESAMGYGQMRFEKQHNASKVLAMSSQDSIGTRRSDMEEARLSRRLDTATSGVQLVDSPAVSFPGASR